jgi:TolB-like protein/DNA-binding winged helix-turn-helix (wHTH) protein/Flp pilus assembly protein TadD
VGILDEPLVQGSGLKPVNPPQLRIGDWRVDPAVDEISRGEGIVKLEPRAMRLLIYLAERAGQVVSVEDLLKDVWSGVIVTSDSVYQAVAALRRILGDDSKNPQYIATLPKRGYRLIASVFPWNDTANTELPPPEPGAAAVAAGLPSGGRARTGAWYRLLPIIGLSIIAAYFAIDRVVRRLAPAAPQTAAAPVPVSQNSIAVLPFVDMSEKKDKQYFGDGMAEEILDLLAKVPGLTLIGRTSSFQFKGKNEDLRTIGTRLNAAYVLEGSVRNSGDRIRIAAQLINTRTGAHEWSETYDRPMGDVLKLQDTIAVAIARELQLTVAPGYLDSRATVENAEAYDLYLRGRHAYDRTDAEGTDAAAALFRQALDRDPNFADAAAWLASTYMTRVMAGSLEPTAGFEQAHGLATVALKLDPKSAQAHAVLSSVHSFRDWDWAAAERELQQAMSVAPGNVDLLSAEATLSYILGRWDEALRLINAALAQDPLNPETLTRLSWVQDARGHLPEAEAAMRRVLDIRPAPFEGHHDLGILLLARGERDAALLEMQLEPDDYVRGHGLAIVYSALGRKADSDAALAGMLKLQTGGSLVAVAVAEVYAFRGQSDQALYWLERAYAQKERYLFYIKADRLLKNIESDPRFKAIVHKMNLPD